MIEVWKTQTTTGHIHYVYVVTAENLACASGSQSLYRSLRRFVVTKVGTSYTSIG